MSLSGNEDFRVRLTGGDIAPEKVSVRLLSEVLEAVRQLAYSLDIDVGKARDEGERNALHLVGQISRGSAVYRLSASHASRATEGLKLAGQIVAQPALAEHHPHVLRPTEELSKVAKSLGCTIEIYSAVAEGDPIAKISPETYGELAASALVKGTSSVSGTVVRVGGATKYSCALRVPTQPHKLLICRLINQDLARSLAQSLFKRVTARGEATWYRKSWTLHSFVAFEIDPATNELPGDVDVMQALRAAGGYRWNEVGDPDAYLSEIRGE